MTKLRFVLIAVLTVSLGCQTVGNVTGDLAELKRTWDGAFVYLPAGRLVMPNAVRLSAEDGARAYRLVMKEANARADFANIPAGTRYPVIVYMHGCNGISGHDSQAAIFLAGTLGVAVIQPSSFAREYRPRNCDPKGKSGGAFRGALDFRIVEANYAIRAARKLPWIDPENAILMGHSEGGITTSKFIGERVNARVVSGATCHYGWDDWSGLDAPETEPVLALLGADDPWVVGKPWWGEDCGSLMSKTNGSRSIVVSDGAFANLHAVLFAPEVKRAVVAFIKAHIKTTAAGLETKAEAKPPTASAGPTEKTRMKSADVAKGSVTVGKAIIAEISAQSERWQDSGVNVERGQTYRISASGKWTINSDTCGWSGPDGGSGPCAAPLSAKQTVAGSYLALIGRIGDGPAFLVGGGIELTADRSGRLSLRINDAPGGFENNEGSVTVRTAHLSTQ